MASRFRVCQWYFVELDPTKGVNRIDYHENLYPPLFYGDGDLPVLTEIEIEGHIKKEYKDSFVLCEHGSDRWITER